MLPGDWPLILTLVHVAAAMAVTVHAVLNKRDVRAAIGWTSLAWLAPFIGSAAYAILGVNRIRRTATRMGLSEALRNNPKFQPTKEELALAEEAGRAFPEMVGLYQTGGELTGRLVLPGNSVRSLEDGDQSFPAMLKAVDSAEHTIGMLSYIFDSDRAGERFLDALKRAKDRGVEVRVLVDDVGTKYSKENMVKLLQDAGVTAAAFLPTSLWRPKTFSNLRNHRKILVIDGKVGFTGGTNIREAHELGLDPDTPTSCLHFRFEGPVVAHMKEAFVTDWAFTTGETLSGPGWFPVLDRAGSVWARGISHGPDEDFETLQKVLFSALAVAQRRVRIVSPYFLPDARLIEALSVAALRGVSVEIYLPSENNVVIVDWAAMAQLDQILTNGCKVFITRPPFDHTKLMIVDDVWALVGSTNWDPRSLRLNFEFNVECYHSVFARELNDILDKKAEGAREVTLAEVQARPLHIKLRDGVARLFSPYL